MAEELKSVPDTSDQIITKLQVPTESPHQPPPAQATQQKPKPDVQPPKEQCKKEEPKKEEEKQPQPKPQQKKEEKAEEKKQSKPVEKKKEEPEATVDDFAKIDIRVGQIKEVWKHPDSDNLYCQEIDIGEEELRQIGTGLQKFLPIEQMTGLILVMANIRARKFAGFTSNGMVVANSNNDESQFFLAVPKGAKVGERVVLQGFEDKFSQERQPELNSKKKILEKCIGKFTTDAEGAAMWNGHKLKTSGGYIMCPIPNGRLS